VLVYASNPWDAAAGAKVRNLVVAALPTAQSQPSCPSGLVAADTVEQKILAMQKEKAALANAVVQEESLASVLDLDSLRQILA
jgi:hypothetical protein